MSNTNTTAPVTFVLTYEVAPTSLSVGSGTPDGSGVAGDFTVGGTNDRTGCSLSLADAATTTPELTISGCSNLDGNTLTISVAAGESSDAAGNTDVGAGPSTTVTVDESDTDSDGCTDPNDPWPNDPLKGCSSLTITSFTGPVAGHSTSVLNFPVSYDSGDATINLTAAGVTLTSDGVGVSGCTGAVSVTNGTTSAPTVNVDMAQCTVSNLGTISISINAGTASKGTTQNAASSVLTAYISETAMVTTWAMATATTRTLALPLSSAHNYQFVVEWGDGITDEITAWNDADASYTYGADNTFTVTIYGQVEAWDMSASSNNANLTGVTDLGTTGWKDLSNAFKDTTNLASFAGGNTLSVTTMSSMFEMTIAGGAVFQPNLSSFNTSSVTDFTTMFANHTGINPNVGSFDFSAVTGGSATSDGLTNIFNGTNGLSLECFSTAVKVWGTAGVYDVIAAQDTEGLGNGTKLCSVVATERNNLNTAGWARSWSNSNTTACTDSDANGFPDACEP